MGYRQRLTVLTLVLLLLAECLPMAPANPERSLLPWRGEASAAPAPRPAAAKTWNIAIGDAGFNPALLTIVVGDQVEWHNTTDQIQDLRSGTPHQSIYLPAVMRSGTAAAGTTVEMAAPPAMVLRTHYVIDADHFESSLQPDATFAHTFGNVGEYPYYLANRPAITGRIVVVAAAPPPVPPNTGEVPIPLYDSSSFLYTGDAPQQTGMQPGAVDARRVVVLRGGVLDRTGAALPGAKVTILGNSQYGQTLTQADGSFDMVVNGGGPTTIVFEKAGFLPVQRTANLPWQDYVILDTVVLIPLDAQVTTVDLASTADFQVARGTPQSDADGTRQATLLVGKGINATMTLPDGTAQPLTSLKIRATEYTVGDLGAAAMPANLPPTSGYTYAVEFTVDEALAAGATDVQFSRPLINYTENFIGAPVGSPVPTAYYDRRRGQWFPSRNGRVIRIVDETGDQADVDVTGDGQADGGDTLSELGITDAERTQLASLYDPGQELWRVAISHFTPWDHNWPFGPPPDAQAPRLKEFVWRDPNDCRQAGSIIGCESQTLGEAVTIVGTPFNLVYQSDRVPGWKVDDTIDIPITGPTLPPRLKGIQLVIEVAGRHYERRWCDPSYPTTGVQTCGTAPNVAPNLRYTFHWDGLDAYNRSVYGRAVARIQVTYVYEFNYYPAPEEFDASFAQLPNDIEYFDGRTSCGNVLARYITDQDYLTSMHFFCGIGLRQTLLRGVGAWDASASDGLGGWTLDVHHAYDPQERVLHMGDGTEVSAEAIGLSTVTVAGNAFGKGFPDAEGGPATNANIDSVVDFAIAPDGNLYAYSGVSSSRNYIVRVDPNGTITTFAGISGAKDDPTGDGGPALQATLGYQVNGVAVGPDGSIYFTTLGKNYPAGYVRKISPTGIITTVAGVRDLSGTAGDNGDGGPAVQAKLSAPLDLIVGPDGSIYFGERATPVNGNRARIRKIDPNGTITTVAGGGTVPMGDPRLETGLPATAVNLGLPYGLAFGPDGSLYIAHPVEHIVTRVAPDGRLTRYAGNGQPGHGNDGNLAAAANIGNPVNLAVARDGDLYIRGDDGSGQVRIRRVGTDGRIESVAGRLDIFGYAQSQDGEPAMQTSIESLSRGLEIAPDGALFYSDGRYQIRRLGLPLPGFGPLNFTLPSQDGSLLYEFDPNGRHLRTLNALTGGFLYRFDYDSNGRLAAIVDADGNTTQVHRTAAGWPTAIVAPGNQRTALEINGDGYLSAVTSPAGHTTRMAYGSDGLLASMVDPRGGISRFSYSPAGRLERDEDPVTGFKTLARVETETAVTVTVTTKLGRETVYVSEILPNGDRQRTVHAATGTATVLLSSADGTRTEITSDGTRTDTRIGPDPRWGMSAPLATTISVTTPSGLHNEVTVRRTAQLDDPNNPLSVTTLTEQVTINGRETRTVYSAAEQTLTTVSPEGRRTVVTMDAQGRTVQESTAGLLPLTYTYNGRGWVATISQGTGGDARTTALAYSPANYPEAITDPLDRVARFTHDADGLATTQTLPDGQVLGYAYDANGNLVALTPPGRPAHTFTYTAADRPEAYTPPGISAGAAQTTYVYNDDGQLTRATRPDGQNLDLAYDAGGRLASVTTPRGGLTYGYDAATGNLTQIAAPQGINLTYSYDGELLTGESWSGPVNGGIQVAYDKDFQITSTSVNGDSISFAYDRDGLLTGAGALTLNRDRQNGLMTGSTLDSVADTWAYTEFGEAETYRATANGTVLYVAQYTYDKLGRIVQKVDTIAGVTDTYTYRYDLAGRLDQVSHNDAVLAAYTYDANGNRLTGPGVAVTSYDDQDRLLRYGDTVYTYNPAGDLASKVTAGQTTSYQYDVLGNLVAVSMPEGRQITYLVDGRNRRIGKAVDGALVQGFLYEGQVNPVAELDGAGQVISRFIYASRSNVPDYLVKGGVTYRILADHVGSPRLVVNAQTGQVVQRMDYDAFGNVTSDSNPGFQPFGFAGGLYDRDTKLIRFGARDYDAATGRWAAKDPLGFDSGDTNLYVYVGNDPINLIDPSGEIAFVPILVGAAVGAGIELGIQLLTNGGRFNCVNWGSVGLQAGLGAFGGFLNGTRMLSNTGRLLSNSRTSYRARNLAWDNRAFGNVSRQYWRASGGASATGNQLGHVFVQNQSRWAPQGLRNAGLNLMEMPASINHWAGGRLSRELAVRGSVIGMGANAYRQGSRFGSNLAGSSSTGGCGCNR